MSLRSLKSVYAYSDYRAYLHDYFAARNQTDSSFSHRIMAKELGFSSPNYIKLVMDGKRNIGLRSLKRLLEGLGLREREREYFSNLVLFCQAKTSVEKNFFLGQLASFRPTLKTGSITPGEYRYYNEWYHCVVRELVVREKAPVHIQKIAEKIRPKVTPAQVEKSVKLLLELGMINKDKQGGYKHTKRIISTDREVTSLGVRNYHSKMIELGKQSIDTVKPDKREISSLTVCISGSCRKRLKKQMQDFQNQILQIVKDDEGSHQVHQINFQFFPLTQEAD